ncbi:MAG TPA: hypothetical protein VFU98_18095 [Microlunatus sp.]|nr:hypothetical protein [Microlunatus sp.]
MTSSTPGPRVVFAGENPLIWLYGAESGETVAVASLWRARHTERGAGTSLLLWADPEATGLGVTAPAAIFTDNLPLARWLWDTFNRRWEPLLGHGLEEATPQPAQFVEVAAAHEHRVTCRAGDRTIDLVWRRPLDGRWTETHPYEYRTTAVIVPCLDADIVVDGVAAAGEVRPHDDEFVSSAVLAFCETWVLPE